ncbi:hypothetical protein CANCADRAFT_106209 [Tortispora caseinolytica NRRL Y-17796]|uniref:Uncharacterized protein n=1 Tax=Tortispora caseinolytica NRRL Y-17796 TaxID=767744 RepID=A0A1E4TF64_9ASCO|nr:hypothetical protein CANCADRAFT_106209 [Tortispora caseinolytica NRRL Y-17796]
MRVGLIKFIKYLTSVQFEHDTSRRFRVKRNCELPKYTLFEDVTFVIAVIPKLICLNMHTSKRACYGEQ